MPKANNQREQWSGLASLMDAGSPALEGWCSASSVSVSASTPLLYIVVDSQQEKMKATTLNQLPLPARNKSSCSLLLRWRTVFTSDVP